MYCRDILLFADTTLYGEAELGLQEVLLPLCPILLRSKTAAVLGQALLSKQLQFCDCCMHPSRRLKTACIAHLPECR